MIATILLEAVRFLHHNGVAHRDIKPENTMYPNNEVKLIDFGWADVWEEVRDAKGSSESLGKVMTTTGRVNSGSWTCPEQKKLTKFREYNPFKADIYACGMILYTLLSGKTPRGSPRQVEAQVKSPACAHIPAAAKELILQMTNENPVARFDINQVSTSMPKHVPSTLDVLTRILQVLAHDWLTSDSNMELPDAVISALCELKEVPALRTSPCRGVNSESVSR